MTLSYENKIVLVTGGANGIGRDTALAFAREGAKVVIADFDEAGGAETVSQVCAAGGEALFVRCDVTQAEDVRALFEVILSTHGQLDCAFNNAGIEGDFDPLLESSDENFDRVIAVNLKGVWLCLKEEVRIMRKQKGGAIVNTASVAGMVAERGYPAYAAAKGGVIQLTRTVAIEYAATGVRVNAVCPGAIRTPMLTRSIKNLRVSAMNYGAEQSPIGRWITDKIMGSAPVKKIMIKFMQPVGRAGEPEEIAAAVLYLCSDPAKFVTGQTLVLDGGMTAQ
ncbi:MAG: SDR family oxidoreductase [Anaerolineales bacterium]|nr:SDR family oxidoreductase [Anaerolineales bacterium]